MADLQKTIKSPVSFNGKGLHTGKNVTVELHPAPADYWIKFQRIDLDNQPIIEALTDNVVKSPRATYLQKGEAIIQTTEHLLSALVGLGVDNVLIKVDGPEIPILDGSAKFFVQEIEKAGIADLDVQRDYFEIKSPINYYDDDNGVEITGLPDDDFKINVLISYNTKVLHNQFASLNSLRNFKSDISQCRTFVFLKELEPLLKANLIKGGDLQNAIVFIDEALSQQELDRLADLFEQPRVEVKPEGILNNLDLNFDNEAARHKLLDIIGDLALVGKPIKGRIIATRPGHDSNLAFASKIRALIKKQPKIKAPEIDFKADPVFDTNQIRAMLPHRWPFLLIDKILYIDKKTIIGQKNVTANEQFFLGHFPNQPVMPGVLIVEAMAQTGGIMVLHDVPDPENYSTLFMKLDAIKFRKMVVPGDTLIFKLDLKAPIRRGIAYMNGQAFVGDNLVAEGEFMAQVTKK